MYPRRDKPFGVSGDVLEYTEKRRVFAEKWSVSMLGG